MNPVDATATRPAATSDNKSWPPQNSSSSSVAQSRGPPVHEYRPCLPTADTVAMRPAANSDKQSQQPLISFLYPRLRSNRAILYETPMDLPADLLQQSSEPGADKFRHTTQVSTSYIPAFAVSKLRSPVYRSIGPTPEPDNARKPSARGHIERRSSAAAPPSQPRPCLPVADTAATRPPASPKHPPVARKPPACGRTQRRPSAAAPPRVPFVRQQTYDNFICVRCSAIAEKTQTSPPPARRSKHVCYDFAHLGSCTKGESCRYNHAADAVEKYLVAHRARAPSAPIKSNACEDRSPPPVIDTSIAAVSAPTTTTPRTDQCHRPAHVLPASSPSSKSPSRPTVMLQAAVVQASPVSVADVKASPSIPRPVVPSVKLNFARSEHHRASLREKTLGAFPSEEDLATARQSTQRAVAFDLASSTIADVADLYSRTWPSIRKGLITATVDEVVVDALEEWLVMHPSEVKYPCSADGLLAQLPSALYKPLERHVVVSRFAESNGIKCEIVSRWKVLTWLSGTCNASPLVARKWLTASMREHGSEFFYFEYSPDAVQYLLRDLRESFIAHLVEMRASDLSN